MIREILRWLRDEVRILLWKNGLDMVRRAQLSRVLVKRGIHVVIDVGANEGQFANQLRRLGYSGRIISFEPSGESFRRLQQLAKRDPNWEIHCLALGDRDEERNLNIAPQSVFNSLLDTAQQDAAAGLSSSQRIQQTSIRRLDDILPNVCTSNEKLFLKTDTQGFDHEVTACASGILAQIQGIQIELSLRPLYRGQPRIDESIQLLRDRGFALWSIHPVFTDRMAGRTIEVDGIFWRE